MTVTWIRPQDDGGVDITGYVIKYGNEVDKYTTMEVGGNTTEYRFQFIDQHDGWTYRFAVAAVNSAGQGEFSEFSDYVHTWRGE